MPNDIRVEANGHGQYTAYVNGKFYGNYDSVQEAVEDIENEYQDQQHR